MKKREKAKGYNLSRFAIGVAASKVGRVVHVVRAATIAEAQARVQAAHPGGVIYSAEKIKDAAP